MAQKDKKSADGAGSASAEGYAVLLELETLGFNAREVLFQSMSKVLDGRGVQLSRFTFARHCALGHAKECIAETLKDAGRRISPEKIETEAWSLFSEKLSAARTKASDGFVALVSAARDMGAVVGCVSCLEPELATALLERTGAVDHNSNLVSVTANGKCTLTADAWLSLARQLRVTPGCCVALASSAAGSQAALAAGMRNIAVPDRFTDFQDFGGADEICDTLSVETLERALALLDR